MRIFTAMLLVLLCVGFQPLVAQQKPKETKDLKLDSLQAVLEKATTDTAKVRIMCAVSVHCKRKDVKKASEMAQKAFELAQKTKVDKYLAQATRTLAGSYENTGNVLKTVQYYKEAIELYEKMGDEKLLNDVYNELGIAYFNQYIFDKALEYFAKAMRYAQKTENKEFEARLTNNLGALYARDEDFKKSEEMYLKAYNLNKALKKKLLMMSNLNNLGNIYRSMKRYDESLKCFEELLELGGELKDSSRIYIAYGNMSIVYKTMKQPDKALAYSQKVLQHHIKIGDVKGIAGDYDDLAGIYLDKHDLVKAEEYALKSVNLLLKANNYRSLINTYYVLAKIYEKKGETQEALAYYKQYISIKDSLENTDKAKQLVQMRTIYETESKEAENQKLRQKNDLHIAQKSTFYAIGIAISFALLGVVAVAIILYRNNAHKHRLNQELTMQKAELAEQKEEIQVQNEELRQQQEEIITQRDYIAKQNLELTGRNEVIENKNLIIESSIQVALQIQNAMLPYPARMQATLGEYFVLNKPKDIVSGDYYWLQKQEGKIILAVIDCVGHGVPGALMSMIAHALLDKVVVLQEHQQPADILKYLDEEVKYALQTNTDNSQGGMDAAIVIWTPVEEGEVQVTFGGAKRPLFVKRPNSQEIEEIGSTRRSIGGEINVALPFTQQTLSLEKGTIMYLFSDGITDQNDIKRNRIGGNKLKDILLQNAHLPMPEQKARLEHTVQAYMEGTIQRDDIVLVGVKL
jgi:serine phosphatase RsbU (regulator of sigma subunit)